MKRALAIIIYISVLCVIVPLIIVLSFGNKEKEEKFDTVLVLISDTGEISEMNTSQYLKEVVAAEMPATFSEEALKAQAVAARTYLASKRNKKEKIPEHNGADVCTDSTHCKAWMSEEKRKSLWEEDKRDEYWDKISKAVESTAGEILTYNGEAITAVFHSTSSGRTENAKDVWGNDVPYLQSVQSEGDELSPKYSSEATFTIDEYKSKIEANIEGVDWSRGLFSNDIRSDAGGIISVEVGGVTIKGTKLREILGLRSTNAIISEDGNNITFKVSGYGHGVGMSQYGADYMGKSGSDYTEILHKYYPNTTLK